MSKRLDFVLAITNFFHGHWEDPEWGRRPENQVLIGMAIRDLAAGLHDTDAKAKVLAAANQAIEKNAGAVTRG